MRFRILAALALVCIAAPPAMAQSYPNKPIHIIVGQAAGGGMDTLARLVGQRLSQSLGQPVIVENKAGAAGIIATSFVAKAPADGYTLLLSPTGNLVFNPILYTKLPYSPQRDFAPISMIATFPLVLVVNPAQPFQNVKELVAYMKAHPDKSNYSGSGPAFQFASELFKIKTGTQAEFIQYKGSNEAITAILGGDVLLAMADTGPAAALLAGGKLRALAVTSHGRLSSMPNVPTMTEIGYSDLEIQYWGGLLAPAGTPPAIVKKLEGEVQRIVRLPEMQERMNSINVTPAGSTSEEFAKIIASDIARWSAVAKASNIKTMD